MINNIILLQIFIFKLYITYNIPASRKLNNKKGLMKYREIIKYNLNCGTFSKFNEISKHILKNEYNNEDLKNKLYLCIHFLPIMVKKTFIINTDLNENNIFHFENSYNDFKNNNIQFIFQQRGGLPLNLSLPFVYKRTTDNKNLIFCHYKITFILNDYNIIENILYETLENSKENVNLKDSEEENINKKNYHIFEYGYLKQFFSTDNHLISNLTPSFILDKSEIDSRKENLDLKFIFIINKNYKLSNLNRNSNKYLKSFRNSFLSEFLNIEKKTGLKVNNFDISKYKNLKGQNFKMDKLNKDIQ